MDTPTHFSHSATCVEEPRTPLTSLPSLTLDLNTLPRVDKQLSALLPQLIQLDDSQLVRLAAEARRLEACAFRLRGACVAELQRRIQTRFTGGRGRRDTSGVGIKAQLSRLASEIGVGVTTLKIDARIHEAFFADAEIDPESESKAETGTARRPSLLPREFYAIALSAPHPHEAIRHAQEKCAATANYTRNDFRNDLLSFKQTAQPTLATAIEVTPKIVAELQVRIMPEAHAALTELVNRSGQTPEEVVAEALLAFHRALIPPAVMNTPTTVEIPSPRKKERIASGVTETRIPMSPSLLPLFGSP